MKAIIRFIGVAWFAAHLTSSEAATTPAIQSVFPAPGTISTLTQLQVVFSEPVTNVFPSDLIVGGFPAAAVIGAGASYTFTVGSQPAYGTVEITWDPGHAIVDRELPPVRFDEMAASSTWQYTLVDLAAPVVSVLNPPAGAGVRQLTQVEVTFSEGVLGVDAADLLINGAPAAAVSAVGSGRFRFSFPSPAPGAVQMAWAAGNGIHDFATPANALIGGEWSYTLDPNLGLARIRINEFTTANVNTNRLKDEDGELSDWIEIWNFGNTTVNLAGYSLTDDAQDPGRWTFPATNLAAGQYLIVFASEKDRRTLVSATNRLHTNFKLGQFGNYLGLYNAESPRVMISEFAPEYPEQRNDYSYGFDAAGEMRYFFTPTPGTSNGVSAIAGVVPPVHFNNARGLYDEPFALVLDAPLAGATIRYTMDGTEPTESAGSVYGGPLTISNTTVLRAAAFKAGLLPSLAVTHSYVFVEQVVNQPNRPVGFPTNWGANAGFAGGFVPADYEMDTDPLRVDPNNTNSAIDTVKLQRLKDGLRELPTLSIVMKTDDIFGTAGIYQRSAVETGTPGTKPENKKPCSVELILPDGTTAFATTCGIDLHGNASRNPIKNPKHGFKLKFRGEFGPGTLNYRLFEDSAVEEYDDILLRADFNSSWRHWSDTVGQSLGGLQRTRATRTRDAWMKDSMREMGGVASHSRFVHLYLNGLYWGTYDISEDPSVTFGRTLLGGTDEDYDVVDQGFSKGGSLAFYNAMLALPAATNLSVFESYKEYLNLPEFIDYMALHFFMGHQDWSTTVNKNWYSIRKRVPGAEGTFRYLPWDGECILLNEDVNRVNVTTPPSGLHTKLDDSAEYRLLFADRVHRSLVAPGGALTPALNVARWQKWQAVMDKPIVAESVRWGDYRRDVHQYSEPPYVLYTREIHWVAENVRMLGYFSNRTATVLGQLRSSGMYPQVSSPVFNQHGGHVGPGFALTMSASNAVYFTLDGSDPRVSGSGAVAPGAQTYGGAVTLTNAVVVKARARSGTNWSALNEAVFTVDAPGSPLRITEIMYNPTGGDAYEFLELRNVSPLAVNVGYFTLSGIDYVFPPGTILQAGQVIVLGSDAAPGNWAARYPGVTAFGRFGGSLANGGERLGVRDAMGRLLWSVEYNDAGGWPVAADGGGASLEIIDVHGDPDAPGNWRASDTGNGTPGLPPAPPIPSSTIVLSEIMADNGVLPHGVGGLYPDWIELQNISAQPVDIAGWSLSDNSDPRRYVFPATNVAPGGFVLVWLGAPAGETNDLTAGFALNRSGQSVFLYDAATNVMDRLSFGLQLTNRSIARVAGAWVLAVPTPRAPNVAAATASVASLALNEWLPNPLPGFDGWVEVFNRAVEPVALSGATLAVRDALSQFGPLSFVPPGGFVVLEADGNPGGDHLDFSLAPMGGSIVLTGPSGAELDRVNYGALAAGVSQGRLPDGTGPVVAFSSSQSPGASNYLLAPWSGPSLNEVLAINRAAATNVAGRTADFVELINTNSAAFDLGGARLSTSPENPAQWFFPAGTILPANDFLVVWFDEDLPASTNAGSFLNTGRTLDGESDEVVLFSAAGQPVDSVTFGIQVADRPLGRTPDGWRLLAAATPGAANAGTVALGAATALRFNEWSASPAAGPDWFELYNRGTNPVALGGLFLSDSLAAPALTQFAIPALSFIGGNGHARFLADGDAGQGRNHVSFSLDGEGEALRLFSVEAGVIDSVSFGAQRTNVATGRFPDGDVFLAEFAGGGTPGASNFRPHPAVVINEVLTHTDPPLEDAIELYNRSGQGVDLGGWFLSDTAANFRKFRIPDGTWLPAGGYRVFTQVNFDNGGPHAFSLDSAHGDEVILSEADNLGNLTGYRAQVSFGAALNGVSFGRHETCHGAEFVPQSARSFGADAPATLAEFRTGDGRFNNSPGAGPVVISELMYHPPGDGTNDNVADEFIELHNAAGVPVDLFDPAHPRNTWRLRGGVSLNFPTGVTLPSGGFALVVNFDPVASLAQLNAFRARFGVPPGVQVFGPYSGKLDNGGERVELLRPDAPQPADGFVPHVLADALEYGDSAPWPLTGDGDGASLQRLAVNEFGNDAANWVAAGPTAGRASPPATARVPAILSGPVSRFVSVGARVEFNVTACASRPLACQWHWNGIALPGETNTFLVLASVQAGDAGDYSVRVENAAGFVVSDAATLAFMEPPVITGQPQGVETGAGNSVSFVVTAAGAGPLGYQWRRDGATVPGATNATLTLPAVQRADAGTYTVLVSNPAGTVASTAAALTVRIPPTITSQPVGLAVNPGANVTFSATATGVGVLRFQWQFNGINIFGATNNSLSMTNVQLADEGDYRVMVTDDIASGPSQVARLLVRVPPVFVSQPVGSTNVVGSSVTFTVVASGSLPMGFTWRKGSLPVTNFVLMNRTSSFTINNLKLTDAGNYRVVITNSGNITPGIITGNATLAVVEAPVITNQPLSQIADPGSDVTFNVLAGGTPPLRYQWRFDDVDLSGATNVSLALTNVQAPSQGAYQVVVANAGASVTSAVATLSLNLPPRLSDVVRLPDGSVRLQFNGVPGRSYAIEGSANLIQWTGVGAATGSNRPVPFLDGGAGAFTNRFYRARLVP